MMSQDPDQFKNLLKTMRLNDAELGAQYLDMANGVDQVTPANILAYAKEQAKKLFAKDSIQWFMAGFRQIIPYALAAPEASTPSEVSLVLGANPSTVDDVAHLMVVKLGQPGDNKYKDWLIEILREEGARDPQFVGKVLRFWTGSMSAPAAGTELVIQIMQDREHLLPVSHTCFERLDIGLYPSKDSFKQKLMLAVELGAEFGIM
jgi:hypothetical protein